MQISINNLKKFVKIPNNLSAKEIADYFTLHTVEVESYKSQKDIYTNIVVAKIVSIEKHPYADKLSLVKLDIGKKDLIDVVCGADNILVDQKVVLALPGSTLINGMEIKETEIRKIKSFGMICAEDELGLGEDHEGIMVLDKKAKIGQNLADYLNLDDVILEIDNKSLSNRGDLWGYYGLARELSAILRLKLKNYSEVISEVKETEGKPFKVKIENRDLCSRYLAWKVENIEINESPLWLKNYLITAGLKPINNIVDATNYVMLESGQPLHAFCAENIDEIVVRLAKNGESIETIDKKERELNNKILTISSNKEVLAIAGVMGGISSSIKKESKSIILESATFDPVSIRKTSQFLNLRTDASVRFEKSQDPKMAKLALNRLANIIQELCPEAKFISSPSDIINFENIEFNKIQINFDWLERKLGKKVEEKEAISILEHLGFKCEKIENGLNVEIPSWRFVKDVRIKEDIAEEIARIYGYNKFEAITPIAEIKPLNRTLELSLERKIKEFLSKFDSFSEVYNYAFVSEKFLLKMELDTNSHFRLVNPVSKNYDLLRQSLAPNMLQSIINNQYNFKQQKLFEIGRVFYDISSELDKDGGSEKLPYQEKNLCLTVSNEKGSYEKLKSYFQALVNYLFNDAIDFEYALSENNSNLCSDLKADVILAQQNLGTIYKLNAKVANNINLKLETSIIEINFPKLLEVYRNYPEKKYKGLARFPALERDLAFVVNQKISYNELYKAIINFDPLIVSVKLFDVYSGSKLEDNLKSLAFHVVYRANDRTLTTEEVDALQSKLLNFLDEKYSAKIRDF